MNNKDFEALIDNRLKECRETLFAKGKEYSSDTDRLHNFKIAARIAGITPEKALFGMYLKHLVSVMDLINFPGDATPELIKEKIGDSINYHLLLEALLVERCNETDESFETNFKKFIDAPEEPKMPCIQDPLAQHDCFGTGCAKYALCDRKKKKSPAAEPKRPNLVSNPIT